MKPKDRKAPVLTMEAVDALLAALQRRIEEDPTWWHHVCCDPIPHDPDYGYEPPDENIMKREFTF